MSGSLRLNGSTSGFSEITAPDVAGDQTFTLPAAGGTLSTVVYQQGVWTPTPSQGAITSVETSWVRIGNQVTVSANLRGFTNTTSSSIIEITGIPYARNVLFAVGTLRAACLNFGEGSFAQMTLNSGDNLRVGISTPSIGSTPAPTAGYIGYTSFISAQQANTQLVFTIVYQTDDTTFVPINGATIS